MDVVIERARWCRDKLATAVGDAVHFDALGWIGRACGIPEDALLEVEDAFDLPLVWDAHWPESLRPLRSRWSKASSRLASLIATANDDMPAGRDRDEAIVAFAATCGIRIRIIDQETP